MKATCLPSGDTEAEELRDILLMYARQKQLKPICKDQDKYN